MDIEGIAEVGCMDGQWQEFETVNAEVTIQIEPIEVVHGGDGSAARIRRAPKVTFWGEEPAAVRRAVIVRVVCGAHVVEGQKSDRQQGATGSGKAGVQYTLLR